MYQVTFQYAGHGGNEVEPTLYSDNPPSHPSPLHSHQPIQVTSFQFGDIHSQG